MWQMKDKFNKKSSCTDDVRAFNNELFFLTNLLNYLIYFFSVSIHYLFHSHVCLFDTGHFGFPQSSKRKWVSWKPVGVT